MVELIATNDADFVWMLGEGPGRLGLELPPGGVDSEKILRIVRLIHVELLKTHDRGAWMIVKDSEVVGLCSYIRPPAAGEVEIGFGVAASCRNRGYATEAVAAMLYAAEEDPMVDVVIAKTAIQNSISQRVLERNHFEQFGTGQDEDEGEIILWRRVLSA